LLMKHFTLLVAAQYWIRILVSFKWENVKGCSHFPNVSRIERIPLGNTRVQPNKKISWLDTSFPNCSIYCLLVLTCCSIKPLPPPYNHHLYHHGYHHHHHMKS
jgi:hypothetical protein